MVMQTIKPRSVDFVNIPPNALFLPSDGRIYMFMDRSSLIDLMKQYMGFYIVSPTSLLSKNFVFPDLSTVKLKFPIEWETEEYQSIFIDFPLHMSMMKDGWVLDGVLPIRADSGLPIIIYLSLGQGLF